MSCTSEEIAEKRRIAQERLKARKTTENIAAVVSPPKKFYGVHNSTNSYALFMDSVQHVQQNKIKPNNNLAKNRILTQPYEKKNESLEVLSFKKTITCTCSLITDERFVVESSGYSEKLINELKSIPSRVYGKIIVQNYEIII